MNLELHVYFMSGEGCLHQQVGSKVTHKLIEPMFHLAINLQKIVWNYESMYPFEHGALRFVLCQLNSLKGLQFELFESEGGWTVECEASLAGIGIYWFWTF